MFTKLCIIFLIVFTACKRIKSDVPENKEATTSDLASLSNFRISSTDQLSQTLNLVDTDPNEKIHLH